MDVIVFVIVLPLLVVVGVPLAVGLWWGHREVQQQRKLDIGKEEEK